MLRYNLNDIPALQRKYMAMNAKRHTSSPVGKKYAPGVHVEKLTGVTSQKAIDQYIKSLIDTYTTVKVIRQRIDAQHNVAFVTFRVGA